MRIILNGVTIPVEEGTTVAAALLNAGHTTFRISPSGEVRAPLCGMGVCYECRVAIDGVGHQRACMTPVRDGMQVETGLPRE